MILVIPSVFLSIPSQHFRFYQKYQLTKVGACNRILGGLDRQNVKVAWRANHFNNRSSEKHFSLPFLPSTETPWSRTFEGPSNSTHKLFLALKRYKDTARCARRTGLRTRQDPPVKTSIVCLSNTQLFLLLQKIDTHDF